VAQEEDQETSSMKLHKIRKIKAEEREVEALCAAQEHTSNTTGRQQMKTTPEPETSPLH
jgi:hypothetical protein